MKKQNSLYLIILFILFKNSVLAQQDIDKSITVDNIQRHYIIHLPSGYNSLQKMPIIFALHGGGGTDKNTVKLYNLNGLADKNGCIVVYPNAINKAWNMPGISSRVKGLDKSVDDIKFISSLIDSIVTNYKGDDKRVFCTGISRGGMFSLYLAYKLSDRITAIAPVCASISHTIANDYTFSHPTPVLLINGTSDPLVSYNGGAGKFNKANEASQDADMLATEDLVKKIITLNKCNSLPIETAIADNDKADGCTAINYTYICNTGAPVEFIKVINGGHTWPGGTQYLPKIIIGNLCKDFSASEKIMAFFMNIPSKL